MIADDEVRSGQHYWIVVMGPGTESTLDALEVGIPYRDADGIIVAWEVPGTTVPHSRVRRVVQLVPEPVL